MSKLTEAQIDPITLEVLRHRLWMINDEQGKTAAQISGSPVVYEAKDFNSSIMAPDGRSIFVGVYTTRISLCLEIAVRWVIDRYQHSLGFRDGDAFVTNDPWAGAAHQNDILMVAPIFSQDRLVMWTGIAMHEVDVGGPNPGSFTVGAQDVFGEGPLIPPVKLVENGNMREDIEGWLVRNTRTPELNALDLRARLAAINRTKLRISEIIEEYGLETLLVAQEKILDLAGDAFLRRIRQLPNGTWREEGFLDHDGNTDRAYRIALTLTKDDDHLTFNFRGTDEQAPGSVNCTRVGLESGVMSAILPLLCYDNTWSPGAFRTLVTIESEPGTINNAVHPAGVSIASVGASFATQHVAVGAIAKMLACSDLKDEVQANWSPAWQGMTLNGIRKGSGRFTAVLLDHGGGGGARGLKDGPNTAGSPGSPAQAIANVETYEKAYPILYVYRRQSEDTGGPGFTRGGVGLESLIVPHLAEGDLDLTVLSHGAAQPEARGLYGGFPSSIQVRVLYRDCDIRDSFRAGKIPSSHKELKCNELEILAAKQRTKFHANDAILMVAAGGGGYGDPLQRLPELVVKDFRSGLVSASQAISFYGVDPHEPQKTATLRKLIRQERLATATPVKESLHAQHAGNGFIPSEETVGIALRLGTLGSIPVLACPKCGYIYGSIDRDPKETSLMRESPTLSLSQWNQFGASADFVIREFFCPECAHLISVEIRKKDDPLLFDTYLKSHAN